ncbi:MAG: hypothetical protein KBA51_04820 [Kiritimatiellae bacterium]|nr:hypothetical protein [Kiritimatiellia bacterium]
MRRTLFVMCALSLATACVSGAWAQQPPPACGELVGGFLVGVPGLGDSDVYDVNYGVQFEYRHWFENGLGAGAWFGVEQWEAGDGTRHWDRAADGDLRAVPLGLSGLYRVWSDEVWAVTLRAGLGYVWTDSDLRFKYLPGSGRIDVGNGWIADIGVEVDYRCSERMTVFGAVMIRTDLDRGCASFEGGDLQDNHLEGFNGVLGLKWMI